MLLDKHPFAAAFVANHMDRLSGLISEQGEVFLRDAGITIPSRTVSAVLLIGERGSVSAADIASVLDQPHQVATQRIDLLIKAGIVDRSPDPHDGRRKVLTLTADGHRQFARLQTRLETAAAAFTQLFDEIGCDMLACIERATGALKSKTLQQRAETLTRSNPAAE